MIKRVSLREWSKRIMRGDGPEQRGGGSSVFAEPLVRGESFTFQLTLGLGSTCFFLTGISTRLIQSATEVTPEVPRGEPFSAVVEKVHLAGVQ